MPYVHQNIAQQAHDQKYSTAAEVKQAAEANKQTVYLIRKALVRVKTILKMEVGQ